MLGAAISCSVACSRPVMSPVLALLFSQDSLIWRAFARLFAIAPPPFTGIYRARRQGGARCGAPFECDTRAPDPRLRLGLRQKLVAVDLVEVDRLLEQVDVDERLLQQLPAGPVGMANAVLLRVGTVEQ